MPMSRGAPAYSIAAVSKLTGVSCHALRIWERRYGFPVPDRLASGHRRYRPEQVEILRWIAEQLLAGRTIGELMEELERGGGSRGARSISESSLRHRPEYLELIECVIEVDVPGSEARFAELASRLGVSELVTQVITAAFVEVGERWFRSDCQIFEERLVTSFFRRKLEILTEVARNLNIQPQRRVVVGSVVGDRHEGGGLIASLMLERAGWRTIDVGADLPISELALAVERFQSDALALSFCLSRNISRRFEELSAIRGVPVFVAGRSVLNHQSLARRHGLIPLLGPVAASIEQMTSAVAVWKARGR